MGAERGEESGFYNPDETIARLVEENIKAFEMDRESGRLDAYADDCYLVYDGGFLVDTDESLKKVINRFSLFPEYQGVRTTFQKSKHSRYLLEPGDPLVEAFKSIKNELVADDMKVLSESFEGFEKGTQLAIMDGQVVLQGTNRDEMLEKILYATGRRDVLFCEISQQVAKRSNFWPKPGSARSAG